MSGWAQWQARITSPAGTGAGFLVSPALIVTCAHVVLDQDTADVAFPREPGFGENTCRVVRRGPARAFDQPGDYAVLELPRPVPFPPATLFDPVGGRHDRHRDLYVAGFPDDAGWTGSRATVRADLRDQSGDWVQYDVVQGLLNHPQEGFSGAAVHDAETGVVLGMVTDADPGKGIGRMMGLGVLRRHWEALDLLLPLPWLGGQDRHDLWTLVQDGPPPPVLAEVFAEAFPGHPIPRGLGSVWSWIRYVAEELFGDTRLLTFLTVLADRLEPSAGARLRSWTRRRLGVPPVTRGPSTAVLVEVKSARKPQEYRLRLVALAGGEPVVAHEIETAVESAEVRGHVEEALDSLIGELPAGEPVVEFALPLSWLNEPVEHWSLEPAGCAPVGEHYPVVVRDVRRLRNGWRQNRAHTRWRHLVEQDAVKPKPIACGRESFSSLLAVDNSVTALAYADPPQGARLEEPLSHGVPVLLWPREECTDDTHESCTGERFVTDLLSEVTGVPPRALPAEVKRLRAEAGDAPDGHPHCGRGLVLLWDEPHRASKPPRLFIPERETEG